MSKKWFEDHAWDMADRGRRELGGVFFTDSNIAQPTYPLRGSYSLLKQAESPAHSVLDERLAKAEQGRDDLGKEDRGMDRE